MNQRRSVLVGVGVPVLFVISLMTWGVIQNNGQAGQTSVNNQFGEVSLSVDANADFELVSLDGETISIEDFRGSIVVVDFWSSWCAPCKAEGPVLAKTYDKWKNRGVEFIGIAIWDSKEPVEEFIELNKINYVNGIDPDGRIFVDFGVSGIPEKFFVTPEGQIVRKIIGPNTSKTLDDILIDMTDAVLGIGDAQ
ncbi:MAG: TlpA family protein disulfide reductase [SAR202 cluster bacterium]|nr:TlpA family protein disulfide reductase [SAR202 cluster bacterium]